MPPLSVVLSSEMQTDGLLGLVQGEVDLHEEESDQEGHAAGHHLRKLIQLVATNRKEGTNVSKTC